MKPVITFLILWVTNSFMPLKTRAFDAPSAVTFLQNQGQWQEDILYQGTSASSHVAFLKNGLSFAQYQGDSDPASPSFLVWNMMFISQHPGIVIKGAEGKKSVVSYLSGNDSTDWVIHPMEYSKLSYYSVFEKVDLHFFGKGKELKYDYVVHPGGNVSNIRSYYTGIRHLKVNTQGELEIVTDLSTQVQRRPVSWQIINGQTKMVDVSYVLINDTTFGFSVNGSYDSDTELIIDPLFQMVWSSYTLATGVSNNINYCFANAMDSNGNVYLTGMVDSTFPITPGAYSGPGSVQPEIFVAKFSADGTTMLYSTYLPGNSSEFGTAIAVDAIGQAYITGVVDLNITGLTNYPSTANAYQPVHNTGSDAMITVLNSTGTGLVYSSFLGGTGSETGYGIALGSQGTAYIVGYTSIGNFPVVASSAYPTGDNDVFVAKFDISQSGAASLVYSTRIGGGSFKYCKGRAIAVNSAGNAFITGTIYSSFGNPTYPVTPGSYNSVFNTGQDGVMSFVTKLSATLPVSLSYSTLLAPGSGNAIAVDPVTDEVFVAGNTRTFTFPVTPGALQPVHGQDVLGNPNGDAFLIKMNSSGSNLVYSTFIGGRYEDQGTGLAVNSVGEAYVAGIAQDSFPTSPGSIQPENAGTYDFFTVHVNASGTGYGCGGATYIGGSDADYSGSFYDFPAPKVSIRDHAGAGDTISVSATSHSQDFPTTPGVYGPVKVNSIADQPVFFKLTCVPTALPPVAALTYVADPDCGETSVDFTDQSINGPSSWQWSFPGASPASSTLQNPTGIVYQNTGSYSAQLIACNAAGCDTVSMSVQITVSQNINVTLGNDTTICSGASFNLSGPQGLATYQWSLNGAVVGTQPSFNVTVPGTYVLDVVSSDSCLGSDTINVFVNTATVSIGPDQSICENDTVVLVASGTVTSGYSWYLNGTPFASGLSSVNATIPGVYSVTANDPLGCSASDTLQLTQIAIQVTLPEDTVICDGSTITLTTAGNYSSWSWSFNGVPYDTISTISVSLSGIYTVQVTDTSGCVASDEIVIQTNPVPSSEFSYLLAASCDGVQLSTINTSQGAASSVWIFDGDVVSTEPGPLLYATSFNGQLQLISLNGTCSDTAMALISSDSLGTAFVPTVFTPNGDSSNDCFIPDGLEAYQDCFSMQIYNRWGSEVFSTREADKCWDGNGGSGEQVPAGTYFYIITIGADTFTGTVQLLL